MWDSESKVAWTETWYGRGQPFTAAEVEELVKQAYREAKANLTGVIWFGSDEDAYFAGDESEFEPYPPELIEPIESEEDAMRIWWNNYGSAETEADLRELGFGPWIERFGRGMIQEAK